jgi:hypothetical protein
VRALYNLVLEAGASPALYGWNSALALNGCLSEKREHGQMHSGRQTLHVLRWR